MGGGDERRGWCVLAAELTQQQQGFVENIDHRFEPRKVERISTVGSELRHPQLQSWRQLAHHLGILVGENKR